MEGKFLLPHLAIKYRFLGRPAWCLIYKQNGGYTYENGNSKNIQHSGSQLDAYQSYSLGSAEVMLFNGTVSIEILHRVDYDGESIMNI
jgi:hypothetical protein